MTVESSATFDCSWTELSVLGSRVFGHALVENCEMALVHTGKFVWIVDNWALYVKRGQFWTKDLKKNFSPFFK